MTIFTKQGIKILFIHIPKTGGTTFAETMTDLGWEPSFYIRGMTPGEISHLRTTPQHYHAGILKRIFNLDEFELQLSIVRNPFDRLKSEFYWQRIKAYRQGKAHGKPLSFPDPIHWFRSVKKAYKSDKFIHDNHIRPQKQFITASTEIFKLEQNGITSAINKCQNLIDPQTQKRPEKQLASTLPCKGKTAKIEEIELQCEKLKGEITNFYQSDFRLWKNIQNSN